MRSLQRTFPQPEFSHMEMEPSLPVHETSSSQVRDIAAGCWTRDNDFALGNPSSKQTMSAICWVFPSAHTVPHSPACLTSTAHAVVVQAARRMLAVPAVGQRAMPCGPCGPSGPFSPMIPLRPSGPKMPFAPGGPCQGHGALLFSALQFSQSATLQNHATPVRR